MQAEPACLKEGFPKEAARRAREYDRRDRWRPRTSAELDAWVPGRLRIWKGRRSRRRAECATCRLPKPEWAEDATGRQREKLPGVVSGLAWEWKCHVLPSLISYLSLAVELIRATRVWARCLDQTTKFTTKDSMTDHENEPCWAECSAAGPCAYCGAAGACCRLGFQLAVWQCGGGSLGCDGLHCCVTAATPPLAPSPPASPPSPAAPPWPPSPNSPPSIDHENEPCWAECSAAGPCAYCGTAGACCRLGLQQEVWQCGGGSLGCDGLHCCVTAATPPLAPSPPALPLPPRSPPSWPPHLLLVDPGEHVWPSEWFGNISATEYAQVTAAEWIEPANAPIHNGFDFSLPPTTLPSSRGLLTLQRSFGWLPDPPTFASELPTLRFAANAVFSMWCPTALARPLIHVHMCATRSHTHIHVHVHDTYAHTRARTHAHPSTHACTNQHDMPCTPFSMCACRGACGDRCSWAQLEPAKGVYDFSALDANIEAAGSRGWRVAIRLLTARISWNNVTEAPAWLAEEEPQIMTRDEGANYDPADERFHGYYLALLAALRNHRFLDPARSLSTPLSQCLCVGCVCPLYGLAASASIHRSS